MKSMRLVALFVAVLGASSVLKAIPLLLTPGGGPVDISTPHSLEVGTHRETASGSFAFGHVDVSVYSGVSDNPSPTGLTFVYTITNVLPFDLSYENGRMDILSFSVGGWSGFQASVDLGNGFGSVNPESAELSFDGDLISFSFPYGLGAPEIPPGFSSFQLFVYSNATSWGDGAGTIYAEGIDGGSNYSLRTLTAGTSAVPDSGTTALLTALGAGLCVLASLWKRPLKTSCPMTMSNRRQDEV